MRGHASPPPVREPDAGRQVRHTPTPLVSIVVPCYNERATIALLLEALTQQDFPPEQMEVLVMDGGSTDGTLKVLEAWRERTPFPLRVLHNPARHIPAALNLGLRHARGQYILRLDAHSRPLPDYVRRCVETLQAHPEAGNVGGVWLIRPSRPGSWVSRSIAVALAHPVGMGDSPYRRLHRPAGPVDTVPFGAFPRQVFQQVGPFDESLLTNEDYEFNIRLRRAGYVVWLDPRIRSEYFARPDYLSLARQYFRYGYWKAQVARRYPHTLRWRQVLPPLYMALLPLLALLGLLFPVFHGLLALQLGGYALSLGLVGIWEAWKHRDPRMALGVPLAMWIMHWGWGAAFLVGLLHAPRIRAAGTTQVPRSPEEQA